MSAIDETQQAGEAGTNGASAPAPPAAPAGSWDAKRVERAIVEPERNDIGNAQRLVGLHKNDIRYVPGLGWHHWDGRRWAPDIDGEITRCGERTAREICRVAGVLMNNSGGDEAKTTTAKELWKWGLLTGDAKRLGPMMKYAQCELPIIAEVDDLDTQPMLLNATNGTLDLATGRFHEHRRTDLITKLAGAAYDPEARCPRFLRFLTEITAGDSELIAYIQRAAGYSMTADTGEQCFFIVQGGGENGKSTLLGTLAAALGDYAVGVDAASFTTAASGRSVRSDLARLRNARFVRTGEIERGATLAESQLKQMTGGDPTVAAFKFRNEIEFVAVMKLWLMANGLPRIIGRDHAIWRRVRIIPLDTTITRPIKGLTEKLCAAELPGILAWAVAGAAEYQRHGLEANTCTAVARATAAYRHSQDRVERFVTACCDEIPEGKVPSNVLHDNFRQWEQDEPGDTLAKKEYDRRLTKRGNATWESNGAYYRLGLQLKGEKSR